MGGRWRPRGMTSSAREGPSPLLSRLAVALHTLSVSLDAALRIIDDIGLTTRAPLVAREVYWRNITQSARNDPCPCRSGRKGKRCIHEWGDSGPEFPSTFDASNTEK